MKKLLLLLLTTYAISLHAGRTEKEWQETLAKHKQMDQRMAIVRQQSALYVAWMMGTINNLGANYCIYPAAGIDLRFTPAGYAPEYFIQSREAMHKEVKKIEQLHECNLKGPGFKLVISQLPLE
jgi:putative heme degradation protein